MVRKTFLHAGWQFAERSWQPDDAWYGYSKLEWLSATVPGHVHLDLMDHGIIPDPFVRMNELGVQWVDDRDWSYRTTFEWTSEGALNKQVLHFEGLDTACDVVLNGSVLCCHDNMFVPLEIDVTGKLLKGSNELRIDFVSANRVGEKRQKNYFDREKIPADTANFFPRAFVRKVQCMSGWDWGPRLVSCGIWQPVSLVEFDSRVTDVWVRQEHSEGKVTLDIQVTVEGDAVPVTMVFSPDGELLDEVKGSGKVVISDPELWWPNGDGAQPLYHVVTDLDGQLTTKRIGLRTIKLVREKDEMGESFEFEVNGRRIYMRGACWIPDHSFPATISDDQYMAQIERAVDMNMNMLRIWGGGLYELEGFYDACDELGILVWQDFMFACSHGPDTEEYYEAVSIEAEYHIKRLRSRTSHAIWCGNNENCQVWWDKWGGADKAPARFYGENLYFELFPRLVEAIDPGKDYWPGSAWGGDSPNQGGIGDQHNWDVWHGRGDWRAYTESTARFCSEFGFASSCALSVWEESIADEDWDPRSPVVRWHDKTKKGTETFIGYVKLHYPDPVSLEDWTYYSQLNQRDALRYGIEHYRRVDFCRGTLIWQMNDIWPTQSWAVVDSSGNYKAAAYELRRVYAPVMLSIERDKEIVRVYAVNDSTERVVSDVNLSASHLVTGEVLRTATSEFTLDPRERKVVLETSVSGLSVPDTLLVAESNQDITWQLLGEPKDSNFAAPGEVVISTAKPGVLEIKVDGPVVDLMLTSNGSPAPFHENFLTLPQGGIALVSLDYSPEVIEARSLSGDHRVRVTRSPLS